MAAPAHLAVAGEAGEAHGGVVTPSAAQALTASVFNARPAARARGVAGGPAEARGVLQVDQVSGTEALAVAPGAGELGFTSGSVGDAQNPHGRVVSVLQQPPGVMEGRQLLPASPYCAGARDAVTLAGGFQSALHRLRQEEGRGLKRGRNVSSFSLIHYLASYLGGLSGQRETVSCRVCKWGFRGGGLWICAFSSPQSKILA